MKPSHEKTEREYPEWWDDVETVKLLHKTFRTGIKAVPDEYINEHFTDEDLEQVEAGRSNSVVFEKGDEIPPSVVKRGWYSMNDRLAAFDADGERLDTPHSSERKGFTTGLGSGATTPLGGI